MSTTRKHLDGQLVPPHDLDAEMSVLGSMTINPDCIDDVALVLRAEDFYAAANQTIFETLIDMADEGKRIDLLLLQKRLEKVGKLDDVGGQAYLVECHEFVPTASNVRYYASIVRDMAIQRQLITAGDEIIRAGYDRTSDPRENVSLAESRVFQILQDRTARELAKLGDVLHRSLAAIDSRVEGQSIGLTTSYPDVDALTGGMRAGELVILAARPSMGKTALACNIAERLSMDAEHCVLFTSLEMPQLTLADRIICSHARVSQKDVSVGRFQEGDKAKLVQSANRLSACEFYIQDGAGTLVSEIAAHARRLKRKNNLSLVVVDYLQRLRPDNSRDPREQQVAAIAQRLKNLAIDVDVPVLCLAQLNRKVEEKDTKRPHLQHLRESGAIEQEADQVWFIHRDDYFRQDGEPPDGTAELIVRKNRNGETGTVHLVWLPRYTRFESAAQPGAADRAVRSFKDQAYRDFDPSNYSYPGADF